MEERVSNFHLSSWLEILVRGVEILTRGVYDAGFEILVRGVYDAGPLHRFTTLKRFARNIARIFIHL